MADDTTVLMKFEHGVGAYYQVKNTARGPSSLQLMVEETVDLFCFQNPIYVGCISKTVLQIKEAAVEFLKFGYLHAFLDSDTRLIFKNIIQGIDISANTMYKKSDEQVQEFANRIAKRLDLTN